MEKLNVLIIGNGHYATGMTSLSDKRTTDKDSGILLPSVLALKSDGLVGEIGIAAREGVKLRKLRERLLRWKVEYGWSEQVQFFPAGDITDGEAYKKALVAMPRPLIALIAVPDHLHKDVMLECVRRNVAFFIVKPAVVTLVELYEVLAAIDAAPVFGMVDYHKVFDEANILLKTEYQRADYGKINHVNSLMTQRRDMLEIYGRWLECAPNLNINHYLGSHYIHLLGYMTKAMPLDIRATRQPAQGVADMIETQVRWEDSSGHCFTSYHISGWNDPRETESMTYQELHLLCENGHIDSDQRYRGFRKVLSGKGYEAPNPYFFNLTRDAFGKVNLSTKYGFISVRTFVTSALDWIEKRKSLEELDAILPTIRESERVTAILEAADHSLANNSKVVKINCINGRYQLELD